MTKKERILTQLYLDESFNRYFINKKYPEYSDDLKQEIFEYLLGVDDEKIIKLHEKDELKRYVHQIIKNQNYLIINSQFNSVNKYKNIKDGVKKVDFIDNIEICDEELNDKEDFYSHFDTLSFINTMNVLTWAEREIFSAYYIQEDDNWLIQLNGGNKLTQDDIAKILNVRREKINLIIRKIKKKIKNALINEKINI